MNRVHTPSVKSVSYLRWTIPLLASLLAVGYIVFEQGMIQGYSLLKSNNLRMIAVMGCVGPTLIWLALTWAERATRKAAQMQQDLAFRNRELAALNVIGEATAQSLELDEIPEMAVAKMRELLNLDAVELRLLEREMLVLKAHHGVSPDFVTKEKVIGVGHCLCGKCVKTGKIEVQGGLQSESSLANTACAREGFESSLSIPMKSKGRVVGLIHVASHARNAFSETDQETLVAVANRVATSVENSVLYEQAKRHAIQLETTSLIGQQLTTLLDQKSLLSEVVRLLREKFGYYHTAILLTETETGDLVLKEASGPNAELLKSHGLRLKIGEQGITGWVAHTGQAFLCNDVSRESRYYAVSGLPHTGAELAVPLRVGNRVTGVLDVQSDRVNVFGKEDITILQILGNQLGIALQNAHLFQETRQRYEAMIALHETSLDMISQLDMPELLSAFLRRGVQLLGAHGGVFFLYDPARELISSPARYNTYHDFANLTWAPGEGLIGRVIQTGKPLIVNDYENWEGREAAFSDAPLHHTRAMGVPLIWQNQVIGGVNILNRATDRPFDQNDLWLMSLFGDLATIAIKNAELHTQVKEFNQDLECKVSERTQQLLRAKEEIAAKAKQLRKLLNKTIRIQEEEQARIARDMHDGMIQLITATKYEVQAARVAAGPSLSAPMREKLDAAREVLDEMEKEIRRTIYDLHPAMLDAVGFVPALQKYGLRFQEISGIACDIKVTGAPTRLPSATEIAIYRLVEEALNNVAAHSNAKSATVLIDHAGAMLSIAVQDDGQGFDYVKWKTGPNGKHLGLVGMQERVESLAGEMQVWSELGQGTCVTFHLPIAMESVR